MKQHERPPGPTMANTQDRVPGIDLLECEAFEHR